MYLYLHSILLITSIFISYYFFFLVSSYIIRFFFFFFFQAEDGIRDVAVTGVQTCALPIYRRGYRYKLHPSLKGVTRARPDFVFMRERVVVFVDGCFWHWCPQHGTKIGRASCRERV